ncbi:FHF complex subunit HOOK interacting protein 1B [Spea bombifrons]|uniref:FHF complex subunit HOOK interacting protein 1B n=1 Tax=Spea bombifrons TaxID=233779 RepID=UPI002348F382|nr:FHF complex subunit HOOK interacting protein 1B [Spea bombifrons]XP_053312731.1 FHF complex subunit HOOK interacting protein 1B [Spea bombifrons]
MSWLSKLNPRGAATKSGRNANPQPPVTADPETCLMVFKNHWSQVLRILERHGSSSDAVTPDDLSCVRNNTYQMVSLLAEEQPRDGEGPGPILGYMASEGILERILRWHLQRDFTEDKKVEQLKLYEMLISQSRQPLLRYQPVLRPLVTLLGTFSPGPAAPVLENNLVLLLNQLCVTLAREPSTLELFFLEPVGRDGAANLLIFSLLVPFIHHEGVIGQQARDALLLIMAMSSSNPTMAKYITENSFFCPILATGLSALYSSLPRKIEVRGDDWHFLRRDDWAGVSSIVLFMNSLEFCNAVTQVAHPVVQHQLVEYIHNGFLVPVMGPALHKTSIEEMIASTAYLELFIRSVSERTLLKTFLRFILLHRHDNCTILHTLISRIASNSRLCMVSLTLFRTLLNLNCEDVVLQLVLRYLIPCNHVMLSQRRAVRDLDFYSKTADKFLSLVPRCCRKEVLQPPEKDEEHATWSKGHGSPSIDTSSVNTVPRPSTPSRMGFFMRQPGSTPEGPSPRSPSFSPHDPSAGSPRHGGICWDEVSELDANYLEYLQEARVGIDRCAAACRVWSAPYDGEEPSPRSLSPPTPDEVPLSADYFSPHPFTRDVRRHNVTPRTKKRSLQEEGEEKQPNGGQAGVGEGGRSEAGAAGGAPLLFNGAPADEQPYPAGTQRAAAQTGRSEEDVEVKKVKREPPRAAEAEGSPGAENGGPWGPRRADSPETVDSLIDELLDRAPAEINGSHVSIEKLGEELKEMESSMRAAMTPSEPPAEGHADSLPEEDDDGEMGPPETTKSRADSLTLALSSPLRAPSASQPFTGPFIAVLFAKLETMLQNSLYVNFLLTGIITQLAYHPQPLLRSFLLNTNMVFQPSVKSLVQVLGSVKNKIEAFAASRDDFPSLLFKAKKFLIARGKLDWSDTQNSVPALRRSDTLVKSRKPSIGELILRHTNSPTRARQAAQMAFQHMRDGQVLHALTGTSLFRSSAEKQNEALRVKNAVYCAVIFTEFIKELAAITQEHALTSPYLLGAAEE